jgi:hypothetical protein
MHNKWLSCYEIYTDIPATQKVSQITIMKCPAYFLMQHARRLGINVLGLTSERVEHKQFLAAERRNPNNQFVLVNVPPKQAKKHVPVYWRLPQDEVYYQPGEATSLTEFHEHI